MRGAEAIALTLLVGLPACGKDEQAQTAPVVERATSPAEADRIAAVIDRASTSIEAAECTELMTQDYLEQVELVVGEDAIQRCEENAANPAFRRLAADSVAVSSVDVHGDAATAEVAISGGRSGGQTPLVALEDAGGWRLDRILSYVEFDRQRFLAGMARGAEAAGWSPGEVRCERSLLERRSDEGLQRFVLKADRTAFARITARCAEFDRDVYLQRFRRHLDADDYYGRRPAAVACLVDRLRQLGDVRFLELVWSPHDPKLLGRIVAPCFDNA